VANQAFFFVKNDLPAQKTSVFSRFFIDMRGEFIYNIYNFWRIRRWNVARKNIYVTNKGELL
jgi:hypothetical protein